MRTVGCLLAVAIVLAIPAGVFADPEWWDLDVLPPERPLINGRSYVEARDRPMIPAHDRPGLAKKAADWALWGLAGLWSTQ